MALNGLIRSSVAHIMQKLDDIVQIIHHGNANSSR